MDNLLNDVFFCSSVGRHDTNQRQFDGDDVSVEQTN